MQIFDLRERELTRRSAELTAGRAKFCNMTAAEWGILVPAVVAVLGSLAAWLRANAAHQRITRTNSAVAGLRTQSAAAASNISDLQGKLPPTV
jgi:hypothetical protein